MAAKMNKMFHYSCFLRVRRTVKAKLQCSFSDHASGREITEELNKDIFYGIPRIAHKIHPSKDNSYRLPPVVIAHGMFGSKSNWNTLAKSIARSTGREVITFDARNHGDSEHNISMSYAAMTYDLVNMLEKLSIDRCILIGHSMGGKTVMSTALKNRELVEKLIVVDSAPTTSVDTGNVRECIKAMMKLDLNNIKNKNDANIALSKEIEDNTVRQFLLTNLTKKSTGFGWRINLRFFKMNFKDLIEFPSFHGQIYEKETLFIGGADSNYITERELPEIKSLFPKAKIQHIENAGHWVHADQPLKFVENVVEFLNP